MRGGGCCEFGAWDGIHYSNCRKLILDGWKAIMIEGDPIRFRSLTETYKDNKNVICVETFVDTDKNDLSKILNNHKVKQLDFLSIDIDGLDFEIFEKLKIDPKVILIEVNAGHNPSNTLKIDNEIAKNNVGQPLKLFTKVAEEKGYILVCYTGNAFFVRKDIVEKYSLCLN